MDTDKIKEFIDNEELLELNSKIQNHFTEFSQSLSRFYDAVMPILLDETAISEYDYRIFFIPSINMIFGFKKDDLIKKESLVLPSSTENFNPVFIYDTQICTNVNENSAFSFNDVKDIRYFDLVKYGNEIKIADSKQKLIFEILVNGKECNENPYSKASVPKTIRQNCNNKLANVYANKSVEDDLDVINFILDDI